MTIMFGKCKSVDGPRVRVTLTGYSSDAAIECLLLQPCAQGPSVWLPPAVGDVVVVAYNEERPEDSVVLGTVYPDNRAAPKDGNTQAAFRYPEIYFGDPVPDTKASRDDRVQGQLNDIKAELDALTSAFNAHSHTVATVTALDAAAIVGAASSGVPAVVSMATGAPTASHEQSYTVGDTASECVWVR